MEVINGIPTCKLKLGGVNDDQKDSVVLVMVLVLQEVRTGFKFGSFNLSGYILGIVLKAQNTLFLIPHVCLLVSGIRIDMDETHSLAEDDGSSGVLRMKTSIIEIALGISLFPIQCGGKVIIAKFQCDNK